MDLDRLPLDYRPPRTNHGVTRGTIRWLVAIAAIFLLLGATSSEVSRWWAWYRARRVLENAYAAQQQCMALTLATGTVVYCEGPPAWPLDGKPGYRIQVAEPCDLPPDERWGPVPVATYHPGQWARFHDALALPYSYGVSAGQSVLYAHARRSPRGHVRLIMIEFCPARGGWFRANLIEPGTRTSAAQELLKTSTLLVRRTSQDDLLEILAGQSDPLDGSHFTIPCRFKGHAYLIDGFLRDDDRVLLQPSGGSIWGDRESQVWSPSLPRDGDANR